MSLRHRTHIRRASESDADAIAALDGMGRRNYLQSAIRSGSCWLAESDGRTLGFVVWDRTFFGHPFIWLLMVGAPYRRTRVASALVRHVEASCGGRKLFSSTNESNLPSQRFFESLGFIRSGMVSNLDEGDPEVFYFKRLPLTDCE